MYDNSGTVALSATSVAVLGQTGGAAAVAIAALLLVATSLVLKASHRTTKKL